MRARHWVTTRTIRVREEPRRALAHGLRFGGYHLPYPSHSSAEQQAEHFLSVAKPKQGDLLPAIDVENKTPCTSQGF